MTSNLIISVIFFIKLVQKSQLAYASTPFPSKNWSSANPEMLINWEITLIEIWYNIFSLYLPTIQSFLIRGLFVWKVNVSFSFPSLAFTQNWRQHASNHAICSSLWWRALCILLATCCTLDKLSSYVKKKQKKKIKLTNYKLWLL